MTAAAPAAGPGAARGPWIASAALAVAIVVAAALAVVTLVGVPSSTTRTEPAAAAPAPSAAPAPAPAPAPLPAGAPAVADTAGRALPAAAVTGVQGLYTALGTGDLAGVESRYAPAAALDAAPWTQVGPLLAVPANREALMAALREPPQRRAGTFRYSAGGARVGVDAQGRMAFLVLP